MPAPQNVVDSIQHIVDSGEIDERLSNRWKQARVVVEAERNADEGDAQSMVVLSTLYCQGGEGVKKDLELSYKWVRTYMYSKRKRG